LAFSNSLVPYGIFGEDRRYKPPTTLVASNIYNLNLRALLAKAKKAENCEDNDDGSNEPNYVVHFQSPSIPIQ
jgi:hypothetical protein